MLSLTTTIAVFATLAVVGGFVGWRWPRATAMLALGCAGAWLGLMAIAVVIYVATSGSADFTWVRSAANLLMYLSQYAGPILAGAVPLSLGKLTTKHLRNRAAKQ